mgnify:CR=1 FL=1
MNPITMKLVVDDLILQALREDITFEDVSTASVCPTARPATVELIAKADGIIAGYSATYFGANDTVTAAAYTNAHGACWLFSQQTTSGMEYWCLYQSDPGNTKDNPVFIYLTAFCRDEHFERYLPDYANLDELKAHYERGGLGDVTVKKFLNSVMQEELRPIRERREMWAGRLPEVYELLRVGSEKARAKAAQTLAEERHAMRIDYFDNDNLLK